VINPATQDVLVSVPRGDAADIDDAVAAAAAAFPAWRDASPVTRAEGLYRWASLCREHAGEISMLESMEVGHPNWGPSPVSRTLTYVAGLADKITGQTLPAAGPGVLGMTIREPYGVCGSIIPWNVPGPIMVTDVAPAIATGNTIVVKLQAQRLRPDHERGLGARLHAAQDRHHQRHRLGRPTRQADWAGGLGRRTGQAD
jgi:aldehyde dehydrogenase (NAD+)